jgi:hypothetical protein
MEEEERKESKSDAFEFLGGTSGDLGPYAEQRFPGDARILQDCLRENEGLYFGQWDYLTVLAWVGSRDADFTAGVQQFCNLENISPYHAGPFWNANRLLIAGAMEDANQCESYEKALADLREALEGERLRGTALREKDGERVTIAGDEWKRGFGEVSDYKCFSLVKGYKDHLWLSHDVMAAFPTLNQAAPASSTRKSSSSLDQEAMRVRREAWAKDAASRGITITDARKDAVRCLGKQHAPHQDEARAILRTARAAYGNPVTRGRPEGSKSYAKQD